MIFLPPWTVCEGRPARRTLGGGLRMDDDSHSSTGYRQRAVEVRAEAANIVNPSAKQMLLNIADNYEKLADKFDRMARPKR